MSGAPRGEVRCAQGWHDPEVLRAALRPDRSSRILSVAASGDSSLALLLQGAGRVVSVDASPAQCALVELKRAAVRTLEHGELLRFVGVDPAADRTHAYARVRAELADGPRAFWDARPDLIARGIVHAGTLERTWRALRERVLPLVHARRTTRAAFETRTRIARERFWHERWNNRRWRVALRALLSGPAIARLGLDPSFFGPAAVDVERHYADRAWHAFVELDPSRNPYLQQVLLGRVLDPSTGPAWLAPENHAPLRERLDDLQVTCSELDEFLRSCEPGAFTGFDLGAAFERMDGDLHERVYRSLVRTAEPGAVIAYWNTLVARTAPEPLLRTGAVATDDELARRLHDSDRSFLHRAVRVDRAIDPAKAR